MLMTIAISGILGVAAIAVWGILTAGECACRKRPNARWGDLRPRFPWRCSRTDLGAAESRSANSVAELAQQNAFPAFPADVLERERERIERQREREQIASFDMERAELTRKLKLAVSQRNEFENQLDELKLLAAFEHLELVEIPAVPAVPAVPARRALVKRSKAVAQ